MRAITSFLAPFLSTTAFAQDIVCIGGHCPGMENAVRFALAEAGAKQIDSFDIQVDAKGRAVLVATSSDYASLRALAALTGAEVEAPRGLGTYLITLPASFGAGMDITTGPSASMTGFIKFDGIDGDAGGGGGGGSSSSDCGEVCVCTEEGVECW